MTWRVSTMVDLRSELVLAMTANQASVSEASRRMGVSRQTAYKWLARYRTEGEAGLQDRSRRPRTSPRRTPAELEERVCELRRRHPAWGGRKLHYRLKVLGV